MRKHIDDFNDGKVSDSVLEPYAQYTKCKFAIANVEPALMGGLFIQETDLTKEEIIQLAKEHPNFKVLW